MSVCWLAGLSGLQKERTLHFHASIVALVYLLVHDYLCVLSVERTFPASLFSAHPVNYLVISFYRGGISKLYLSQSNSNLLIYLSIYE